jgi:carboxyl-terminal processing protease
VIESYIDSYYWKEDVSDQQLADAAAKGMVTALGDKYSVYYTEEEYNEAMNSVNGDYCGIGATLRMDDETKKKYVEEVPEGKPAEKAGLMVGDELLKVNDTDVTSLSLSDTVALIKGEEGKQSVLTIVRKENEEEVQKEITVVCEKIVTQSVNYKMLDDQMGYIQITEFDKETSEQFKNALTELEKQNQSGLIIDVRDNGGGSLDSCIEMLDRILPAGKLITEKSKSGEKEYTSTDEEHFDKPMVVLINGNSASASEIFAGTLQDRGTATLLGETSYGKGIVQTIFSLEKTCGGGLKLTTGEYLLPSGRSIHEKGLTPDVETAYTGTSKVLGDEDDNQLEKAEEILKQKLTDK